MEARHPRLFSRFWAVSLNAKNGEARHPLKNHFFKLVEGPGPRRSQEVVQLPHSRRPVSRQPARRVAAGLCLVSRRCRCPAAPAAPASAGSPGPPCCGRSWSPRPPAAARRRTEAPRRVRRRSEGARVLHCLDAAVCQVLVVLELVGVVLEDPELRGRLLLHVLGRAVHRLVGPRVVGPGRPLEVVAPLPALARHPRGQVLLQRLDAPVHHGNGVAVLGPLRAAHGIFGQLPVQRGELVAQVRRDHEVPVVPRQLLCGALGGAAHRLGVLVLQRFHGGLLGEDVHHHQAVLRLPPRVLAEVDEVGLQPVVGGRLAQRARRGACTCWPTSAFSASKAMACVTSRSRCLASRYSFRGSLTLKSSARSLSASIQDQGSLDA